MKQIYRCSEFKENYHDVIPFYILEVGKDRETEKITIESHQRIKKTVNNVFIGRDKDLWIEMVRIDDNGRLLIEFNKDNNLPLEKTAITLPIYIYEWKDNRRVRKTLFSKGNGKLKITTFYREGRKWKVNDLRIIKIAPIAELEQMSS